MKRLVLIILLITWSSMINAQEPGARGIIFRSGFVAIADDYSTTYWNPAGMGFRRDITLGTMVHQLPLNREFGFISGVFMLDELNRLGISWSGYAIDGLEARQWNTAEPDYYFTSQQQQFWLSYARRVNKHFGFGINSKFLYNLLDNVMGYGYAIDIGLMYQVNKQVKIGLTGYDLISQLQWTTSHKEEFDKRVSLAGSYQEKKLLAAVGIEASESQDVWLAGGVEIQVIQSIRVRMGIQKDRLAMGLGYSFKINNNMQAEFSYAVATCRITTKLSHICDFSITFSSRQFPVSSRQSTVKKTNRELSGQKGQKQQYILITADNLNIRIGPGLTFSQIGVANRDEIYKLLKVKGSWYQIDFKNQVGWIDSSFGKVVWW